MQKHVFTLPHKQRKVLTRRANRVLRSGDLAKQIQMNRLVLSTHIL